MCRRAGCIQDASSIGALSSFVHLENYFEYDVFQVPVFVPSDMKMKKSIETRIIRKLYITFCVVSKSLPAIVFHFQKTFRFDKVGM
jgi:hypothetical protein